MRRANRRDITHAPLSAAFKKLGWRVADTSRVGDGFPDICIAKRGVTALVEFKTGRGARSEGQRKFAMEWPGYVYICASIDDVLAVNELCQPISAEAP